MQRHRMISNLSWCESFHRSVSTLRGCAASYADVAAASFTLFDVRPSPGAFVGGSALFRCVAEFVGSCVLHHRGHVGVI